MVSSEKFKIKKLSLACFILASSYFVYIYIGSGLILIPRYMGMLIGTILVFLIVPMIFSLIAWKFSNNKERSSTQAFIFILVILFFSSFSNLIKQNKEITQTDKAEVILELTNRSSDIQTDLDKKIRSIFAKMIRKSATLSDNWVLSYQDIPNLTEYDYSLLKNKSNYQDFVNILEEYIIISKTIKIHMSGYDQRFVAQFTKEEQNQDIFKAYLNGMKSSLVTRDQIIRDLGVARVAYGESLIKYINLFYKNKKKWSIKNNEVVIDDHELFEEINTLNKTIDHNLSVMFENSNKLTQIDLVD